jgi:hypothetical protein
VDGSDNEQVNLGKLLLSLEAEDQNQVQDNKIELDIDCQALE